ncbi:MAG: major facilitator superfamily domain-containing protein [Benjaminiella poitrasii]|nr:MAG: major facilitator superfamily domain-containing protein [Benjaminiella poitrasii]
MAENESVNTIKTKEDVFIVDDKQKKNDATFYGSSDEESLETAVYDENLQWTDEEEQRIRTKLDIRLMSFILLMTFVLNMDRTNISNAISDNLASDLGFTNDGVNTGTLVYAIVFTIFTLPSNAIVKKIGAHLWIPILMSSWAIVTWAHALIHNFSGFMTARVFIAITEAGFIPACLAYLTTWYKTTELATRLAWFWGIQSFASAVSGLISSGMVGIIVFVYLPANAHKTKGLLSRRGWFTEREAMIATTRIIRDDLSKKEQDRPMVWSDVKQTLTDTKLWTHLMLTFVGMMSLTPIQTYLPSIIRNAGFSVTDSNLLTAPSYIINLVFSILIARRSDRHGQVALHDLVGVVWSLADFLALVLLPATAGRWSLYAAALVTSGSPSWHGMQIAWMSSNLAPVGKRILALGAVVGAANICSVPGSQIYQTADAPLYRRGNWINVALQTVTVVLFVAQRVRYALTNQDREQKWTAMSDEERSRYRETTKDLGSNRLDFKFRL